MTRFLRIATRAALTLCAASSSSAAQEADPGRGMYILDLRGGGQPVTVHLRYGVPGSHDDLFRAFCSAGDGTAYISATIAADTTGLENGSDVQLVVTDEAGEENSLPVRVMRSWAEDFGIAGVGLRPDFDDPLFGLLRRTDALGYAVNGGPEAVLDTAAAGPVVDQFLANCAAYADTPSLPDPLSPGGNFLVTIQP